MRIYFDENFSPALVEGLRRIQEGRQRDDITVHSIREEFGRGAPDETWIPGVAQKHGVVLTQDVNIHRTRAQWELCRSNQIGVIFFRPPRRGWDFWEIVQLIVKCWPEICAIAKTQDRPFGYYVEPRSTKLRPVAKAR